MIRKLMVCALAITSMLSCCAAPQSWLAAIAQQPKPGVSKDAGAVPAETVVKIRDRQLAIAGRKIEMQQMEAAYQKLQKEQDVDIQAIDAIVREAATAAGVDLGKMVFDIKTAKFIARPQPSPSPRAGQ